MKYISKAAVFIIMAVLVFCFSGCTNADSLKNSDKIKIICTTFSEYDWTRQIVGESDRIEIKYLLDNGVDLHNYQPTMADIIEISDCDMFVYVGGASDEWVENVLSDAENKDMKVIDLIDVLGDFVREEEIKDGMQPEDEEENEDEPEYDEHIWLSVRNAEICCEALCDAVCELDPNSAEKYRKSLESYIYELDRLDYDIASVTENAPTKTLLFGDRYPFRYFTDDYNLDYYAAFVGCSSETEASFRTIIGLSEKLDALNLDTVFIIENSSDRLAKAVIENSSDRNRKVMTLNSIQSVTAEKVKKGVTYISIMRDNLDTLTEALY